MLNEVKHLANECRPCLLPYPARSFAALRMTASIQGIFVGHYGVAMHETWWHTGVQRRSTAIPALRSLIGGSGAVLLQVPQDYGLIAAGIIGLIHLLTTRKQSALTGEGQADR